MNTSPSADTTNEVLPQIADHILIRRIGKGGYGEVWLAKNVIGGLRAAKVIYRRRFSDDRPFDREFEGICKFEPFSRTHPGLVTILQVGQNAEAGYFYYVMELADDARTGQNINAENYVARTLAEEMKAHPRMPLETSLQIGLSLASALAHLHAQKLIHRDIKPSNIIFVKGAPKFADIGLLTEAGNDVSAVGSLNYMPPEGPGESTGDVFSLGKVFYELFMGMPCKRFPELPGAAEEFTTVPALLQLNNLILKMCHYDPAKRFQTADEVHKELVAVRENVHKRPASRVETDPKLATPQANVTSGTTPQTTDRSSTTGGGEPPKKRWSRRAALIVAGLAVVTAVSRFKWWSPRTSATNLAPVLVLMDTTARHGVYDDDNLDNGRSNAKEILELFQRQLKEIPSGNINEFPVGLGWARAHGVRSLHPDLIIIHRSVFFHPLAAFLNIKYPDPKTDTPAEAELFDRKYKILGDDNLLKFLDQIGSSEPRTRFIVYSRGTDPKWLGEPYRATWVKEVEELYPSLKGRIRTMLIKPEGDKKASFRNPTTYKELISHVREILGLREKPAQ
jgi:serine/threonine protein kinase